MLKRLTFLYVLCLIFLSSCKSKTSPSIQFGDPIQIQVSGQDGKSEFDLAIAVSKGKDVEPALPQLSSVMYKAVSGCSEFIPFVKSEQLVEFSFRIENGKIHFGSASNDSTPKKCVQTAMEGKSLFQDESQNMDVLLQVRQSQPKPSSSEK